jgi:IclR family pca regulon transcriptional regulator
MVEKNPREDGEYLNSLARGLAVLRSFGHGKPAMTLSELAACTELNPAVVRRCLHTLMHLGYVAKKGKLFLPRPEVFSLGAAYIESMNLKDVVAPYLHPLRDLTGNGTAMAVLSGEDVLFLVYVLNKQPTRIVAGVGTRFPAYATAAGRVLLAWLDKERLDDYFAKLHTFPFTENTLTAKAKLKQELRKIRKQGYATIQGEFDYGVAAVAVPVFAEDQRVVAALACSSSSAQQPLPAMVDEVLPLMRQAAKGIEEALRRAPLLVYSIIGGTNS